MEAEGCCCCCGGEEAAGLRHNTLIQLLRQRETRFQRMAQVLLVALLVTAAAALALLFTVVLNGRGQQAADTQPMKQTGSRSPDICVTQQQHHHLDNPSVMLTAPSTNQIPGEFLEWESEIGNIHCHGGFNYSSGNLMVPRKGIYRVFLQITYESVNACTEATKRLISEVFYITNSYNDNRRLLSSEDTVSCSLKPWRKSLYTSGLFVLEANSRLRVKSSHPELIVNKQYLVFFGAELLPQSSGQTVRVT
ncbi:tumor necrosis factor ligand superfamily member 15 [Lates calcarifer]|uniref:Tumor necrosis factor ligand superfamily member 15 n=1 Tax=Lates calcarifer TaxID=8187 RepID=A0AAJ7LLE7_LATCA|nr:tumor necrosis factor ligand superfamily member 15 [Lates calcarifer]XP_050931021.1 tumor necrosis factor ligand superfamily member 15 [Lates calcarifer]